MTESQEPFARAEDEDTEAHRRCEVQTRSRLRAAMTWKVTTIGWVDTPLTQSLLRATTWRVT